MIRWQDTFTVVFLFLALITFITGSHLGTERTLNALSSRFYWVGMANSVRKIVKNCPVCLANRPAVSMIQHVAASTNITSADSVPAINLEGRHKGVMSLYICSLTIEKFEVWKQGVYVFQIFVFCVVQNILWNLVFSISPIFDIGTW